MRKLTTQESNPEAWEGWLAGSGAVYQGLNVLTRNREFCKILSETFPTLALVCEGLEGCHSPPYMKKLNEGTSFVRDPAVVSQVGSDL